MSMLNITQLSKSFGTNKVIDGVEFSVPEGSIFGFIGPNGAGKTTTMKMALGLLEIDSGEIVICGEKAEFGKTAKEVGYLPDVPEFYNYMKPIEYLTLCGEISGMSKAEIKNRGGELLELVGLSKVNRKVGGFSRGMKQRLGMAQALLNKPKLLICDEPTSALDPVGRKEILDILGEIRGETTVVFSTHILSDVERICDRAVFLHGGKRWKNDNEEGNQRIVLDGLPVRNVFFERIVFLYNTYNIFCRITFFTIFYFFLNLRCIGKKIVRFHSIYKETVFISDVCDFCSVIIIFSFYKVTVDIGFTLSTP